MSMISNAESIPQSMTPPVRSAYKTIINGRCHNVVRIDLKLRQRRKIFRVLVIYLNLANSRKYDKFEPSKE